MTTYVAELRPLLSVMRAVGWFPLRMRPDGVMELRLRSKPFLYSAVVITLQLCLFAVLDHRILMLLPRLDPSVQLLSLIYLSATSLPLLLSSMVALQSTSHLALCNQWASFETSLARVSPHPLVLGLRRRSNRTVAAILVYGVVVLTLPSLVWRQPPSTKDWLTAASVTVLALMVAWWRAACGALEAAARRLREEFRDLQLAGSSPARLLGLRDVWLQLALLVPLTGAAMSRAQSSLVVYNLALSLLCCHQAVEWADRAIRLLFVLIAALTSLQFVAVCEAGHVAKTKVPCTVFVLGGTIRGIRKLVDSAIQEAILITRDLKTPSHAQTELLKFLTSLARHAPAVTFKGYIVVSRGLMCSSFVAVATNLVVMIQLGLRQTTALSISEVHQFSNSIVQF